MKKTCACRTCVCDAAVTHPHFDAPAEHQLCDACRDDYHCDEERDAA